LEGPSSTEAGDSGAGVLPRRWPISPAALGTLIGPDLTNLDKVRGLGAPIASISGAGTFVGIFFIGILAVLFASLYTLRPAHNHRSRANWRFASSTLVEMRRTPAERPNG
jgi:hypothetical protein